TGPIGRAQTLPALTDLVLAAIGPIRLWHALPALALLTDAAARGAVDLVEARPTLAGLPGTTLAAGPRATTVGARHSSPAVGLAACWRRRRAGGADLALRASTLLLLAPLRRRGLHHPQRSTRAAQQQRQGPTAGANRGEGACEGIKSGSIHGGDPSVSV